MLDQTLKHNSSVSFVNTSVLRSGADYDANVSAALFELNDKKNTYNLGGKLAMSNLYNYLPGNKTQSGFDDELHVQKTSGNFNFNLSEERTDDKFTSNDLGYFTNNNFFNHYLWMGYHWIKPKGWHNRINLNFNNNISFLAKKIDPVNNTYQSASFNVNANVQSKKLWFMGIFGGYTFKQNDFYEPRTTGWFFKRGAMVDFSTWFESNDSKKYTYNIQAFAHKSVDFYNYISMDVTLMHAMRFNNKLTLSQSIDYNPKVNDVGYTYIDGSTDINFAKRNVRSIENILSAKYNFTNKMGITFRARYYVSTVDNKDFFVLQRDGSLQPHPGFNPSVNENVNFFNIDMVYTWEFAPGSFINIAWKNAEQYNSDVVVKRYFENLGNTLSQDNNNNLSIKIIYFIDYYTLQNNSKHKRQS